MAEPIHKIDISWDRRPSGTVANVVFDNSKRLNALNPPALLDLTEAFLGLAREDDLRARTRCERRAHLENEDGVGISLSIQGHVVGGSGSLNQD